LIKKKKVWGKKFNKEGRIFPGSKSGLISVDEFLLKPYAKIIFTTGKKKDPRN